jgi:hypothetical protein
MEGIFESRPKAKKGAVHLREQGQLDRREQGKLDRRGQPNGLTIHIGHMAPTMAEVRARQPSRAAPIA